MILKELSEKKIDHSGSNNPNYKGEGKHLNANKQGELNERVVCL